MSRNNLTQSFYILVGAKTHVGQKHTNTTRKHIFVESQTFRCTEAHIYSFLFHILTLSLALSRFFTYVFFLKHMFAHKLFLFACLFHFISFALYLSFSQTHTLSFSSFLFFMLTHCYIESYPLFF